MSNDPKVFIKASDHPDPMVRKAENIGLVLKRLLEDLSSNKITAETLGHTFQKFCVDTLKEVHDPLQAELKLLKSQNALLMQKNEKLRDHFDNCNSGKILTLKDQLSVSESARAKMREALEYLKHGRFHTWNGPAQRLIDNALEAGSAIPHAFGRPV